MNDPEKKFVALFILILTALFGATVWTTKSKSVPTSVNIELPEAEPDIRQRIRYMQDFRAEYLTTDNSGHRKAAKQIILDEYNAADREQLPEDLIKWIEKELITDEEHERIR